MLEQDFNLQISEIQQLSNADAIVVLFASLGYNTLVRLKQTAEAMALDSLSREIKRIERIADQEQGYLQVYLIELKHITVANTQKLAQAFKRRAGIFLLVLTTDYDRLDFVLINPAELGKQQPEQITAIGLKTNRPRTLTVKRTNPDIVALRVLRRFTYTEADVDYQLDKLCSAYNIADWAEPFFNNRALFSDYYLNERLKDTPEWAENALSALRSFEQLVLDARSQWGNEPAVKTCSALILPALEVLGFRVQPGSPSAERAQTPDYLLFGPQQTDVPIACCNAYAWDRNLDGLVDDARDPDRANENPGSRVISVLENEANPEWAIVTNGKFWRLYTRRAHSRAANYYEIDLEEALASPDPGLAFRYFWLFFRSAAYTPRLPMDEEAQENAESFLAWLLAECNQYARQLETRLKERVFEEIFPHFAEGFISHMGGTSSLLSLPATEREQKLLDTFHGTLTFLYRLLFLFYAESRNLLPASEVRGYWEISLSRLKKEIAEKAGPISDEVGNKLKQAYRMDSYTLYDQLFHLFHVIDLGESSVNVPTYNGGLFVTDPDSIEDTPDAANARYLAAHKIPDRFLALGLDHMARDIDARRGDLVMIDYKSLGVQQLGSIYEGLLEFKLRLATEKMAVVRGKKTEEVIPYTDVQKTKRVILRKGRSKNAPEWVLSRGTVYLENDRAERKATGSYYTPDYIVKYIVRNTVGPTLDEKFEGLRPRLREAQKAYAKAVDRQKQFVKVGQPGDDPKKTFNTPEGQGLVNDFFDLRVLDPAMGSGHFLVEAVDFITDRMLAFLNAFPENPITHALVRTRQTILEEMQRQEINMDPARLTNVNLLKRHVLKRCIYGVDLNRMAVELAKVSLWLHCFTLGAPLSFLDHHLKQGNSLIGARIEEVHAALEMAAEKDRLEIPMLAGLMGSQFAGVMLAVDLMRQIGELPDTTADQVRKSRTEFRKAADALAPYRRILDLYTSRWFGNPDSKVNQPVLQFLRDERHTEWLKDPEAGQSRLNIADRQLTAIALQAARDKRFLHWELEFPEVFFGPTPASHQQIVLKENPGFDAVVGNPPWGAKENLLTEDDYKFLRKLEIDNLNYYPYFVVLGLKLLKSGACFSMLLPDSLLVKEYPLTREYLLRINKLVGVIHLTKPFEEVDHDVIVIIAYARVKDDGVIHCNIVPKGETEFSKVQIRSIPYHLWNDKKYDFRFNFLLSDEKLVSLSERLEGIGVTYRDVCESHEGIHTRHRRDDIFPEHVDVLTSLHKPLLLGEKSGDIIDRHFIEWNGRYVNYDQSLCTPNDKGMTPDLVNESWFTQTKLVIVRTGEQFKTAIDYDHFYLSNNLFSSFKRQDTLLDVSYEYLCCLLNSTLLQKFLRIRIAPRFGDLYVETKIKHLDLLPIRRITSSTPASQRKSLASKVQELVTAGDKSTLLSFITARLDARPEESDVVHDLLANLARQMIDLNKKKQAEMKRFLAWLEGALQIRPDAKSGQAGLEALSPKDRLKNYLGDYQKHEPELSYTELEAILERNKSKLGISMNDDRFAARLRQEYEASLAVLRPIKERLAWTDWLIDQIVYKLYGLTEEEIQVIAGSQDQPSAPRSQLAESAAERIVLANTADAALFLDTLQELAQGKRSLVELASRLSARNPLKSIPTSLVEELARELRSLGWVEQAAGELSLVAAVVPSVLLETSATAQQLHLELALAHERKTRAISKLLNRLLALAPQRQGALVIPEPEVNAPADVRQLPEFVQRLVGELVQKLGQDYPATRDLLDAERLAQDALSKLMDAWNTQPPSKRNSRLAEVVRDGFAQAFFDPLATPKELVFTWAPRLAQAGLWLWARRLYGTAGLTIFPVGAFRPADSSFQPIPAAPGPAALQAYTLHDPQNADFIQKFASTLFEEVQALRGPEQREYVSLLAARDRVCYRLRVGNPVFERRLAEAVSMSVSRQIPYSISIEPDRTWQEQSSREMELPVIVNGPRYIISMKERMSK
jgi:hypothetical protein